MWHTCKQNCSREYEAIEKWNWIIFNMNIIVEVLVLVLHAFHLQLDDVI